MVTLPPDFIATKYPGYFWNYTEKVVYSVKVYGELTPLSKTNASYFTNGRTGWRVSVKGQKRWLDMADLCALQPTNTVYPVKLK